MHPLKHVTMGSLRQQTEENIKKLRSQGFEVIEIWEHSFQQMKKECAELKDFLKTYRVIDRLNPRDSFFGGRTNAVKLYHEGDIKNIDFTSLYPWVNSFFYLFYVFLFKFIFYEILYIFKYMIEKILLLFR